MKTKEKQINAIENTPEPFLSEMIDFVHFYFAQVIDRIVEIIKA